MRTGLLGRLPQGLIRGVSPMVRCAMTRVLITGANRGIGLELCRQLQARGDEVVATCRKASAALEGLGVRVICNIDVANAETIDVLDKELGDQPLDVLINNAGIFTHETLDDLDLERIRRQFEVNALGPLVVTRALRRHLERGAKVIVITSRMGSIDDNGSGGYYGYRMSKCALNMAAVNLAHDLRPDGIAVAVLHPGFVATDMTGKQGISTQESAEGLLARIDALQLKESGGFWHANGERLPW